MHVHTPTHISMIILHITEIENSLMEGKFGKSISTKFYQYNEKFGKLHDSLYFPKFSLPNILTLQYSTCTFYLDVWGIKGKTGICYS